MVIRIIFSIVILFLALLPSASQDIIQKYSGEKIEVLIVDISPGVIKYRKFDQQQGPVKASDGACQAPPGGGGPGARPAEERHAVGQGRDPG